MCDSLKSIIIFLNLLFLYIIKSIIIFFIIIKIFFKKYLHINSEMDQ